MDNETTPKKKSSIGRPTNYSLELASEICARLSTGEPVTKITADPKMPAQCTVYFWLNKHPEFKEMYDEARKDGAHTLADQIQAIVDEEPNKIVDEQGNFRVDAGSVAHQRLRMDARKWLAAKYLPKVYGESTTIRGSADDPLVHDLASEAKGLLTALVNNIELKRQSAG
jgi:hypothetical protein